MKKIIVVVSVLFISWQISAQRTVTGIIQDQGGEPLIGANVLVKGGQVGTVTDFDGTFAIDVPTGAGILVISFTGFETQEVDVTTLSEVSVTLKEGELLSEVVVVGYSTTTKTKSSVAQSGVSSKTIELRPNASLVQTLQGQVAGLNISTSNGQPGGNSTVRLRGVSSINGNTEPLFVIDGTPVDEDNFRSLNPNEIKSVSVLKDAGATAIYGNRGANGVIIIETKRGAYDQPLKITYSGLYGTSTMQVNQDYGLMNAQEQLTLERTFGNGRGQNMTDAEIAAAANEDWVDFFFRSAITQSHTIALTSGGANTNSYTSFGFTNQEGILKSSSLQRYNVRNNLTGRSKNDRFNYATNISINYSKNDEPNNIGGSGINRNLVLGAYQSLPYITSDDYVDGRSLISPLTFANTPLFLMDLLNTFTRNENELKLLGSIKGSYKILDNLVFSSTLGTDFTDEKLLRAEGPESFNAILFAQRGNDTPGFQQQRSTQSVTFNFLNSLAWDKTFGDHGIEAAVYMEYFKAYYDQFGFLNNGLDPRTFFPGDGSGFIGDNAANDFFANTVNADKRKAGLFSYFGQLGYDYKGKYGLVLTGRRDASYRFSSSNRWGTFYSVSGRWNIDQEKFMENGPFDQLKLRASYGITGNQDIVNADGQFKYFSAGDLTEDFFATGGGYGGQNSLFLSQIGNAALRWEKVTQTNIGIDFEIFRSRLRGSLDVYQKTTDDLFQNRPVSAINSVTALRANTGSLENRGVDLTLQYDVLSSLDNRGLNMTLKFAGNYNKQNIIDLPTPDGTIQSGNIITREGSILNEYYVYRYAGVNPANGNLLFLDAEGGLTESPSPDRDRVFTGRNIYPDYEGSFGVSLDFRGFFLETQFNYVLGVDRFDFDYSGYVDPTNIGQFRHSTDILRAWTEENRVTDIPSLRANNLALDGSSDRFLKESDFFRLRFINFGYAFPKTMTDKIGIENLRLFVNAENLYTFSKWRGFDAETDSGGSRLYPTPRIISFGAEVGF